MSSSRPSAVVTGAGSGIGRATALRLAREDLDLALLDIDGEAAERTALEARSTGVAALPLAADCGDPAAIADAFARIRGELGAPDILVNNVGASGAGFFSEGDLGALDRLLELNLKAAIYCSREVVSAMRAQGRGKIVNVASDAALIGDLGSWAYASAKAGLIGFTRALARELAPSRINVNAVAPGYTRTAMTDKIGEDSRRRILGMVPMGEVIEPEDIAETIAFLASHRSRFITGQTLAVNGGRWMN